MLRPNCRIVHVQLATDWAKCFAAVSTNESRSRRDEQKDFSNSLVSGVYTTLSPNRKDVNADATVVSVSAEVSVNDAYAKVNNYDVIKTSLKYA